MTGDSKAWQSGKNINLMRDCLQMKFIPALPTKIKTYSPPKKNHETIFSSNDLNLCLVILQQSTKRCKKADGANSNHCKR